MMDMFDRFKEKFLLLAALFLFLMALPLTVAAVVDYVESHAVANTWPKVTGKVVKASIVGVTSSGKKKFRLDVEYEYEVDGKRYRSKRYRRDGERRAVGHFAAKLQQKRHAKGSSITVFYDPKDPSRAVLDVRGYDAMIAATVIAAFLVIFGVYLLRQRRKVSISRHMVVERANFSFTRPKGWTFDRHYDKGHDELLFDASGNRDLFVIGNPTKSHAFPSSAQIATDRVKRIEQDSSKLTVHSREEAVLAGIEGVVLVVAYVEKGVQRCSASFCRGHRGFMYEVLLEAPGKRLPSIRAELVEIVEQFQVIDPEASAYVLQPKARLPLQSERFGYRFTPGTPDDWRAWRTAGKDFPDVDMGLFHAGGLVLTVIPALLPEGEIRFDSINRALLSFFGIEVGESALVRTAAGGEGESEWRHYEFKRTAGENLYEYRIRVVRYEGMALLIVLFSEPGNDLLEPLFQESIESLHAPSEEEELPQLQHLDDRDRSRQADFLQELAVALIEEKRPLEARAALRSLLELNPNSSDAVNQLLLSYTRVEAFESAYEVLREFLPRFEEDLRIAAFEPFLLGRMGRAEEAVTAYRKLFDRGWRDREDFHDYVNLLIDQKEYEEARKLVEERRREGEGNWIVRLVARIHRESGEHDAAIAEFRTALEKNPSDTDLLVALAHELSHASRYEEAIAVCDDLLDQGRSNASVYYAKGVAESKLEWYPKAKRSFQSALDQDPTSRVVKDWLDHVTTQLGQGSNRLLRRNLEPVTLPLTEVNRVSDGFTDASAVHLEYLQALRFERGSFCSHTVFERIRIQNSNGASQWSTFVIEFNPEVEDLFVNELVVRDGGSIVGKSEVEDFFVRDDGDSGGTGKIAYLPVPGLAPGRDLEITYTRRSSGVRTFPHKRLDLPRRGPVERAVVQLSGDIEKVLHRVVGNVEIEPSEGALRFLAKQIVRGEREPFAVDSHRWQPTIWVSEAVSDWHSIGREYLEQIEERLKPDESLSPVAQRVAGDLESDAEKLAALSAFVRKEISYKSIAFGPRAYVPDPAGDVLNARFSDCKGHSVLLYQLAAALKVPCKLALISTDDDFWQEASTRWQFNHMINYCPTVGEGQFVDCVDKGAPFAAVPNGLADRTALVLDPKESVLKRLPEYSAEENRLTIARVVTCDTSGNLTLDEDVRIEHNLSSYMRTFLQARESSERPRAMQGVLRGTDPRIEVEKVVAKALDDGEVPLELELRSSLRGAMNRDGNRWLGRTPALWEWEYLVPGVVQDRLSPFRILMPYVIRTTVSVRGESAGIQVPDVGKRSSEGKFCRWTREVVQNGECVELTVTMQTVRGVHDAEHYADFRAELVEAAEAAQLSFVAQLPS